MKLSQTVKRWWPTAITLSVIIYATLNADPVGDMSLMWFPHMDKLIHAIMFGGLFSAMAFDWRRSGRTLSRRRLLLFAAIALGTGVLDELAQQAMHNGRSGELPDLLADGAGILIAFFSAPPVINHIFRKKFVPLQQNKRTDG